MFSANDFYEEQVVFCVLIQLYSILNDLMMWRHYDTMCFVIAVCFRTEYHAFEEEKVKMVIFWLLNGPLSMIIIDIRWAFFQSNVSSDPQSKEQVIVARSSCFRTRQV